MRRRRGSSLDQASVDLSAMIDMIFILLIFFIVTTTFTREAGVTVKRPSSAQAVSMRAGFVPVAITRSGEVYLEGRVIDPEDTASVRAALSRARARRVVIQADRMAPVGLALRVQDTCTSAGATHVDVAATHR